MEGAGEYTYEPHAFHDETSPWRAPFAIQLIICFLLADGVERIVELVQLWQRIGAPLVQPLNPYRPNIPVSILWVAIDFFLVVLLAFRSRFGLYWTQVILVLHLVYLAHVLAIRHPQLWLYMSDPGRGRVVLTVAIEVCAFLYLFSRQARTYLDR